jgi:hypothetical protein
LGLLNLIELLLYLWTAYPLGLKILTGRLLLPISRPSGAFEPVNSHCILNNSYHLETTAKMQTAKTDKLQN